MSTVRSPFDLAQDPLELHDAGCLQVALRTENGLKEPVSGGALLGAHVLQPDPVSIARYEVPVEALLGIELPGAAIALRTAQRSDVGFSRGRHAGAGVGGRRLEGRGQKRSREHDGQESRPEGGQDGAHECPPASDVGPRCRYAANMRLGGRRRQP